MRITIILFLLLTPFVITAQQINITGKVQDKENNQVLPYATVALLDTANKIIAGTTTNELGLFTIRTHPTNTLHFKIQSIGYHTLDTLLVIDKLKPSPDFTFSLCSSTISLQEITVSAEKITTSSKIDKQIFHAQQLGNTTSGTGLDILQRLPSVTINAEGKILMRGNAEFLVTVSGKFTNQTASDILAQLPANTNGLICFITHLYCIMNISE